MEQQANKSDIALQHEKEIRAGERFEFGRNWASFLDVLSEDSIARAERSLLRMLEIDSMEGRTFLDIGSGSGLFSLSARRLGANVFSFDFDPKSVACTSELKRRYFPGDRNWHVEQASALDDSYMSAIGGFDIVYSWGVLHHTGEMWRGLANAASVVNRGGILFVAIYNDTGSQTTRWRWIKRTYCKLPEALRPAFAALMIAPEELKHALKCCAAGRPREYFRTWRNYRNSRGMNRWHDIVDWVGGYPYEVATVDQVFDFFRSRGFQLRKIKAGGVGLGCNEFVFEKSN